MNTSSFLSSIHSNLPVVGFKNQNYHIIRLNTPNLVHFEEDLHRSLCISMVSEKIEIKRLVQRFSSII